MIIEYELQGSVALHKGFIETTGFWVRMEAEMETNYVHDEHDIAGWKVFNHGSFGFFHVDQVIAQKVFIALINACNQDEETEIEGLGYVRYYYGR